jgi:Caspase domain
METNIPETRTIGRIVLDENYTAKLFEKQHAFIVGINEYKYVPRLKTAANDANKLGEILKTEHYHEVHPICINPTTADLRAFLENMKNVVGEQDSVLFYFAGHGIALENDKGMSGYIVPADAQVNDGNTLIPMSFLYECFDVLPCRHVLLILDCCFAGSIRWASTQRNVDALFLPKRIYKERFERYLMDKAWQVLASASHDQMAFDSLKGFKNDRDTEGLQHSPFALALFDALMGKGDIVPADGGDGIITATELYLYLREQVELPTLALNVRLRQTPSIFTLPKHDKGEYIFFAPNHRLNLPPIPKRNPFKGLQSFEETDKEIFYGRDRVVDNLFDHVVTHPLTVITGASGTGKSSVVKAGLLARLKDIGLDILPVIRPTKKPLEVLAGLPLAGKKEKRVLVIDQFEELLTQSSGTDKLTFIKILRGYINEGLKVILTVRSDFEPQFDMEDWADWQKGRFVVPPFTVEELREIIIRPAIQEVLQFDSPKLVDQILQEVVQSPGALPLLSFTLSELYEKYVTSGRNDRILTEKDYQSLGGVIGSLRKKADKIYTELDAAHKNSMCNVMLRMVSIAGGEYAGKRVFKKDLTFDDATETERVTHIIDSMQEARLVIQGTDNEGRAYVEPAHDALVRAWTKLTEWIKTRGEENVLLQNKLTDAVSDYNTQKIKERLWHADPRLDVLRGGDNSWMNSHESLFVQESFNEKTRRVKQRRRELIGAFSVLGLLLVGAIYFAYNAQQQQKKAEANLIDYLKAERNRQNNRLSPLLQDIENFIKAEETDYALKRRQEFDGAIDSIGSLTKVLKDNFKVAVTKDSANKFIANVKKDNNF